MASRHRRNRQLPVLQIAVAILIITVVWLSWHNARKLMPAGDAEHALAAVEQFYAYEQAGDFGSSWELFHPEMKKRFSKADYIQKRAHIMLQDFGVTTFEVETGHPAEVADWQMSVNAEPITEVYEVVVKQIFQSPYGNFEIVQPCYAANDAGEWKLLWSYQAEQAQE
ncbi:hypothetical protein [Paenibacillus montanisoli]|uniref:DUF4878 domain-containing protein n=1 Tax=Paenibacillus montanisoli TaxID=2081970 RepID=A0A328TXT6_9BACL|nr:hypothetical protein [Paenibacillus montanisoli]RAP75297.1 hypothetical protein DL346_18160 [Paenibacillus montanisoli]